MSAGPNTPGILGYVLACGVTFLTSTFLVITVSALSYPTDAATWLTLLAVVPFYAAVVGMFLSPVAAVGALVVHVLCRGVRQQAVHALAAAVVAWALSYLTSALVLGNDVAPLPAGVALAAAAGAGVGRAAVVPLVGSRRRLAAAGRLTGAARW